MRALYFTMIWVRHSLARDVQAVGGSPELLGSLNSLELWNRNSKEEWIELVVSDDFLRIGYKFI